MNDFSPNFITRHQNDHGSNKRNLGEWSPTVSKSNVHHRDRDCDSAHLRCLLHIIKSLCEYLVVVKHLCQIEEQTQSFHR